MISKDDLDLFNESGICLVVSNETFTKYESRPETVADEKMIQKTFSRLGYDVRVSVNCVYLCLLINEGTRGLSNASKWRRTVLTL